VKDLRADEAGYDSQTYSVTLPGEGVKRCMDLRSLFLFF